MAKEIILPQLGQTMEEATIVRWLKKEGDAVSKGDILLEIQTDKAVLEVESFTSGTLLKILAQPGETLPVLGVIGFIGEPGEKLPEVKKPGPLEKAPAPAKEPQARPLRPARPATQRGEVAVEAAPVALSAAVAAPRRFSISPRARRLAAERVINPTTIAGTGPIGRVIERDVVAYLKRKGYDSIRISPTAKRLAAESDIDILDLRGTGPDGKIVKVDVLRAEAEKPRPLSARRKIIASKMVRSAREIPYFLVTVAVDMTDLSALREKLNKGRAQRVSYNDFILKACAFGLRAFPIVNGVCLGETYQIKQDINIGIAVDLEDGLMVPVIRDVDKKTLPQIAEESSRLVEKAKTNKLLPDEFEGATFTVSNMGMLGVDSFTAIIPPNQAAILAVGSVSETVVARNGKPAVRKIMRITLSSDHRIVDGATAARFLNVVREKLESSS
jgi:pyruvate dehydrogenase E2 component (dihydrolipoamide acetyltransferase)